MVPDGVLRGDASEQPLEAPPFRILQAVPDPPLAPAEPVTPARAHMPPP
jgi:hypothetical protein